MCNLHPYFLVSIGTNFVLLANCQYTQTLSSLVTVWRLYTATLWLSAVFSTSVKTCLCEGEVGMG